MKLENYLQKIESLAPTTLSFENLCNLQLAQITHLPFENLDCLCDITPSMDLYHLEKKLLLGSRGGYCFELNVLFLHALKSLGFNARPLLARSMWRGNTINSKTHIIVMVEINGVNYLADAGFGGPGLYHPIPLLMNTEFEQILGIFKIVEGQEHGFILQKKLEATSEWMNVYAFTLDKVYENDLIMSNFYTAKFPESYFRHNLVISLHTLSGRKTLNNKIFSHITYDKTESFEISSVAELKQIVKSEFHLEVPSQIDFKTLLNLEK